MTEHEKNCRDGMDEVGEVLKRRGLAGVIILGAPEEMIYRYEVDASWTCMQMEGDRLTIRSKRSEYPSREAQEKALSHSVGFLMGAIQIMENAVEQLSGLVLRLSEKVEIKSRMERR